MMETATAYHVQADVERVPGKWRALLLSLAELLAMAVWFSASVAVSRSDAVHYWLML